MSCFRDSHEKDKLYYYKKKIEFERIELFRFSRLLAENTIILVDNMS